MTTSSPDRDDPPVVVCRVVDAIELACLEAFGDYGSNPGQSGKYCALTRDGAQAAARASFDKGATVTRTTLPASIVRRGMMFHDPGPHGAGMSVFFSQQQLADVHGTLSPPVVWSGAVR